MKKYKCLIIDDEELARELIETHLSQLSDFEIVASCASAIDASKVLKEHLIDLLFLDIEMPVLKGTDFYASLSNKPKVIFTTAHRNYALDGFELDAVDYLLKPIVFSRFFIAIERFLTTQNPQHSPTENIERKTNDHVFVTINRKQVKIAFDDILYIRSLKDYIEVHLTKEKHVIKYTITAFEKQLSNAFVRVHRSYIINMNKMTAYTKHDIEIDDIEIPIGENYKNRFFQLMKNS